MSQSLNYAEDGNWGHPYPYENYPPEIQTVRYFSLTHQYLLKDDPKNMMPTSNIIDLDGSHIKGNQFHLSMMDGWSFQSKDPVKFREIEPEDIRYSIDEASYLNIFKTLDTINNQNKNILKNTLVSVAINNSVEEDKSIIANLLNKIENLLLCSSLISSGPR